MRIVAVIPCYKVKAHILEVLSGMPTFVNQIFVVDDACPEGTGAWVQGNCADPRVSVIFNDGNRGVGGAVITGIKAAIAAGAEIVVKVDGDGQMRLDSIAELIAPLISGLADCTKANRFYDLDALQTMPTQRRIGNFALSLAAKFASGNWHISDPTNGFVALHTAAVRRLSLKALAPRYFFEISLLIQLNIIGATTLDVPVPARYGSEKSNLSLLRCLAEFPARLLGGLFRRIYWRYFVFEINAVTLFLFLGLLLSTGGLAFGIARFAIGVRTHTVQTAGTVALSFLPIILGFQMLLQAIVLDIVDRPQMPLQRLARLPSSLIGNNSENPLQGL
jgi:glycosyltransferase involved in cell wall biosynthesis